MDTAFTSTRALNNVNRTSILRLQLQLTEAQKEASTGRHADVGETLGGRTSETVSLRLQHSRFTTLTETNGIAQTRIDGTQSVLEDVRAVAEDFLNAITLARDSEGGAEIAQQQARSSLVSLMDGLNTTISGEYLFAGINTSVKPIADYYAQPTSSARGAVDAAFSGAFGTTQSDPSNSNITPAAMQSFLDTNFAPLFDTANWDANWSSASSQNVISRISMSEEVISSANATEQPFRLLAQAYTMVADLGVENLNDGAFAAVVDTATQLANQALVDVTGIQSRLGIASERISSSNEKMSVQQNLLTEQVENLENVDPFAAATRVNTLLTQLETSYAMTARVQRLSILNFL